ncbi:MAG: methionine--tRNA ligase [Bacillota bacterium]|nr:methionine--tRNA ligase [Bacillota bacterium]
MSQAKKTFYITTPIYYPNAKLHVGHTYTTVLADSIARFKRERGFDVLFTTGTDEHGQKIQESAERAGKDPQAFVDEIVAGVQELWKKLEIQYDRFTRTTGANHIARAQSIFQKLLDSGDIYQGEYEGHYCIPDEAYWTDSQLVDGNCPTCGGPVTKRKESSYFFRLSKYQDRLLKLFEENPDILEPHYRVNEMVNNFIKPGLEDLSISRSTLSWGVPLPNDPSHVIYVWIEALCSYLTNLGYPDKPEDGFDRYWPADVHLIAKEIVRFHTIIWFALLMALDLPIPKKVFAHGWILIGGRKLGKRDGAVIADPLILIEKYGVDALKYFLLAEYEVTQDGAFTTDILVSRINSDLANDFGNLVSRSIAMVEKYRGGIVPSPANPTDFDESLRQTAVSALHKVDDAIDRIDTKRAMAEIWAVVGRANKYIDETAPWALAKSDEGQQLDTVLYHLIESLRIIALLIRPFLPATSRKLAEQLGVELGDIEESTVWGGFPAGNRVKKGDILFPRIDIKAEQE